MSTHNPWDGTVWDTASPDIDQVVGNHYKEMYDLRKGIAIRINKEHKTLATSSAGGEHIAGGCQVLEYDTAANLAALADAVEHGIGFSSDTKILYRYDSTPTAQILDIDHGSLSGLSDDDHTIYSLADGTRAFTGVVAGVTPVGATDLVTKAYVDSGAITFTNKTLTSPVLNTGVSGTAVLDEDDMATDSNTQLATQQSIKAYVDATYLTGQTVQVVNVLDTAVDTTTTQIPADNSIPTSSEGKEVMSLAITPTSATNKLKIEVVALVSSPTAARTATVALFQDAGASAIKAAGTSCPNAYNVMTVTFIHYMAAGTTSETTFKVRAGMDGAGTFTWNGGNGTRLYGGVAASSITITEIQN